MRDCGECVLVGLDGSLQSSGTLCLLGIRHWGNPPTCDGHHPSRPTLPVRSCSLVQLAPRMMQLSADLADREGFPRLRKLYNWAHRE